MANRTNLRQMVAEEAGVIAAGEALAAADVDYIERRITSIFGQLYEDGLVPFDVDGDIPDAYMLPLAQVMGIQIAAGFGLLTPDMPPKAGEGMASLRRLKAKPYYGTPARATYY